jgi:hypothetical protein
MATYTVENGYKKLVLDDASKVDVVAPLSLDEGQFVRLIPAQLTVLNNIKTGVDTLNAATGANDAQLVLNAEDLAIAYTYNDPGTANQRIATVVYTSTSAGHTVTDTYAYAGSAPNYYLTSITRVTV